MWFHTGNIRERKAGLKVTKCTDIFICIIKNELCFSSLTGIFRNLPVGSDKILE